MQYRNFIRRPDPHQCFGSDRRNRLATQARKLDIRLSLPFSRPEPPEFNESIPSGYTYLGQFAVHDCIFSSPSTPIAAALAQPIENLRRRPLQLDTLYGAGPEGLPIAYLPHRPSSAVRTKFKLSSGDRDIGRGQLFNSEAEGATEALIADPRNDVHASIAQITMLFQVFHNLMIDQLLAMFDCDDHPHGEIVDHALFLSARSITTGVFRRIVRHDLLPRLLHPIVYERYFERDEPSLDRLNLDEMPWEFAQAFRFGHVMVRPIYFVNPANPDGELVIDMMLATSLRRAWRTPLDESWMIQWSRFFQHTASESDERDDLDDANNPLNLSRRIRPSVTPGLHSSTVFSPFDRNNAPGLIYRDLISSSLNECWSVAPLIAEIAKLDSSLTPLLQQGAVKCKSDLHRWLSDHRKATDLTDDEIVEIGRDPPLLVYVLMEAACTTDGRSLGPFGSIIVAETLRKALDGDDDIQEIPLSAIAGRINCNFRPEVVQSMADLIRYISKYVMASATPEFV